ncbi:MAG: exonuclease domain-containing protein [Gammaproteobacteria bacterium]|nr:exonuclease domain-containing protein [Gammaproteobacteria bacterium]
MQTYLFYDIETTGLNKAFDQVLQFAAIRTDLNLQEIERHELRIKLNADTIPAPKAIITHYIGIKESLKGDKELDAIRQIHQWMNTPGTISVGYNTLGFDDEFLRFSFYRNLLSPYTHQFANRCARMDLYPITAMYSLFKKDILNWPMLDGKTTLKLEHINTANQFVEGRAHHAMVDVEVTLALARRFFQMREMWDYATGYFNKNVDKERYQQLPLVLNSQDGAHREGIMLDGKFGSAQFYQAPVLYLGEHKTFTNQTLWLRLDTEKLRQSTMDNFTENAWVVRKKWGEPGFVLPPKERFQAHLSVERQAEVAANKLWLTQNPDLFQQIVRYHREYLYPVFPNTDVSASLYQNGFWNEMENSFCRRFHQVNPTEKSASTEILNSPKLKSLAIRLIGRHYPESLSADQKREFDDYIQHINHPEKLEYIIDFKGEKRLSPLDALNEIAELREAGSLNTEQLMLLDELEQFLREKIGPSSSAK